ncbi:MAG: hypothetical protein F4X98_12075 [Gammaproteobacteria bacterium]|nr:hypothetical protein [Chloroflexota bacterium]MYD98105.1 hypothetical protein [Gammaproteobacteria bacterium]
MRLDERLRAFAWELAPWLDMGAAPAFLYVLTTGRSPRAAHIWSLRALRIDECGNPSRFGALIRTKTAVPPDATAVHRVHPRRIPYCETFEQVRPRLDAFLADSPVISVDPGQLDTKVLAAEYWRELWRAEGFMTTRTPALPDLESAAPGRTLLDIGRGHLAAAHGLGWRHRPSHAAHESERGRAA